MLSGGEVVEGNLKDKIESHEIVYKEKYTLAELTHKEEISRVEYLIEMKRYSDANDALVKLSKILPNSPRCVLASAMLIDRMAELEKSNAKLRQAVDIYKKLLNMQDVDESILYIAGRRLINRLNFLGKINDAIFYNKQLVLRIPNNFALVNDLGISYLMVNRPQLAKEQFINVLNATNNKDSVALCHYAFILKQFDNRILDSIDYFKNCLKDNSSNVMDGRFFYHLGDALQRLNRTEEAYEYYQIGVEHGIFNSIYQRSLYNEPHLSAKPWWTIEQTTYKNYLKPLEENWLKIRDEALKQFNQKTNTFMPEDENLRDKGDWKQLNLYARGLRDAKNCKRVPFTCSLVEKILPAVTCTRGQIKFSVMQPGVHVWPHCGPTNCRIRSHLGLAGLSGARIRVANETREWHEGQFIIFDDSFEHEVWHDGNQTRLVLIVDLWHPELSVERRAQLLPI
jgi:aspartate beta-hydroxylase